MKHAKSLIVAVLLLAMLLSGCGQAAPALTEAPETAAMAVEPAVETVAAQPLNATASERPAAKHVGDAPFHAKFEGSSVAGSGGVVDGAYRFIATQTDGEAWHVKLESNYPTIPGHDYRVTYRFRSNVKGTVKFGDFQQFTIKDGNNSVTGTFIATSGTSYLDLQLGMLPPFTIDFTEIEVEELADEVDYTDALAAPIDFENETVVYEKHDQGYGILFERTPDSVQLQYVACSWENAIWKSRVYVRTGMIPEAGKRYRVTGTLLSDNDTEFETLLNDGDKEKGYGAMYGQFLTGGVPTPFETALTGTADGDELVLQFSMGNIPEGSFLTLSDFRVEEIHDHYVNMLPSGFAFDKKIATGKTLHFSTPSSYTPVALPGFTFAGNTSVSEDHQDGYAVSLDKKSDNADIFITQAPASGREVWKVNVYAATGVTLEANTAYRVKLNLTANQAQKAEVSYDGNSKKDYGAEYGLNLAAGNNTIEHTIPAGAANGALTICVKLGDTPSTSGNTFNLSNITLEKLNGTPAAINYNSFVNVAESHYDGLEQTVSASGSTATLNVTQAQSGGGVWSSKLFVHTGFTPQPGTRYRVTAKVNSGSAFTDKYELLVGNGVRDSSYGGNWSLTAAAGENTATADFTAPASGCGEAVLTFQFGNTPAPNSISVSNIQFFKLNSQTTTENKTVTYPVTTAVSEGYNDTKTLSLSASAFNSDGTASTADLNNGSPKLTVTQARNDGEGGVWSMRLHVGTGLTLETGAKYQVSATVSATADLGAYELLFEKSGGTDEYYGRGTLSGNTFTGEIDTTSKDAGELILRFQFGNSAAPNEITVTGITVKKWTDASSNTEPGSFAVWADDPAQGTLTGDGAKAVAKVITPAQSDIWKLKFVAQTFPAVAGATYNVSLTVAGGTGAILYFQKTDVSEDTFGYADAVNITSDPQTISANYTVAADKGGEMRLLTKIGGLAADSEVTISGLTITETRTVDVPETSPVYTVSTMADWAPVHSWVSDDYSAYLTNTDSSSTIHVTSTPASREDWKVKLYADTGVNLKSGKTYQITATLAASADTSVRPCYIDQPYNEIDLGDMVTATPSGQAVSYVINPTSDLHLELMFKVGNAASGTDFTISNVTVAEMTTSPVSFTMQYDSVGYIRSAADLGYITSLEQNSSAANFHITQAPAERHPWNVKLHVRTGFTPKADQGYRVSFDISSTKPQNTLEVFYDGSSEAAYGAIGGQKLPGGPRTVSYIIAPGSSKGELSLQIRLGQTDGTDGNDYVVSNLKIDEVGFTHTTAPENKEAAYLDTLYSYTAHLERQRDRASVVIEKTPSQGLEAWKNKLFVETGVKLKAGQKYRITADVKSIIPAPFEVCFNNDEVEKGLAAIYGLMATPYGQHIDFATYVREDTQLVLQLSLGNCPAPNTVILSNLKVERAGTINLISDTIYTF